MDMGDNLLLKAPSYSSLTNETGELWQCHAMVLYYTMPCAEYLERFHSCTTRVALGGVGGGWGEEVRGGNLGWDGV